MLRRVARQFFALLFLLATGWFTGTGLASATASGTLLIGEVNWTGSSRSTADEWLELWNRTDLPVDLTGFRLTGAAGTKDILFDGTAVIPPRSAFLVANYPASDTKSGLAIDPQVVTSTLSLPNDKLLIRLFDADGLLVDEAGDGGIPPAGISSSTKASMIRLQDGGWKTADESQRLDEGVADFGTPGICDVCDWTERVTETTTTEVFISATTTLELPTEAPAPAPEVVQTDPVTTVIEIRLPDIRLAKIFPSPSLGKEWVELSIPADAPAGSLDGWSLYDAAGKILTLNAESSERIEMPSSRLNNGGDSVELHRPDGSVAERMSYTTTPHNAFWEKNTDATAWILNDPNADPPEPIIEPEPEIITKYSPPPPPIELPTIQTVATGGVETGTPTTRSAASIGGVAQTTGPVATKKKAVVAKPKTTVIKTTTKAAKTITFDMLTKIEPNTRITLSGVVGTQAGILSKYHFVLLAPDGRGLHVQGSSKQPSPAFGATVRVTGTLTLNDDGLMLKLGANDRWAPESRIENTVEPRAIDFLDIDPADSWSLVEVTGTVREVKSGTVALDLDGVAVDLRIKASTGYRAARLAVGDTLHVRAVADTRGETPALYPRQTDDIEILSHAKLAKAAEAPRGLPDWTPFGAAGITVAITQGVKRLKRLRDERRIAALAQRAATSLFPS